MDFRKLERFIFNKVSASRLPGLSIALVDSDEVVWQRGFGFRDLERGLKTTPATLYAIGSVTKSFTAVAIQQLAEQGKLSVNDPLEKYIPEFSIRPFGEQIRLWHLLSHSSGLPGLGFSEARFREAMGGGGVWLPIESHESILYFIEDAGSWAAARPGERYFYLNEGFILLGAVIENLTGMPYNQYVIENILKPLKMTHSLFERDDYDKVEDKAVPYVVGAERRDPASYVFNPVNAKGGLISNVEDLARYVRMHMHYGELDGARLISAESSKAMQTGRVRTTAVNSPFGEISYGFGLAITDDFFGTKLVGHGGSVSISTSYIGFLPEKGLGVALITNGSGYSTQQFGQYALAMMMGEDPDDLPFVQKEKVYAMLSGHYSGYRNTTQVSVKPAGDYLMLQLRDDRDALPPVPLTPVELTDKKCTFTTLSGGSSLEVEFFIEEKHISLLYERYGYRKALTA